MEPVKSKDTLFVEEIMKSELEILHNASMTILEKTGVRLYHPEIVRLLKDYGIRTEGDLVFFKKEQIMELVKKAPSQFTVYARNPEHDMVVGKDENGSGVSQYVGGYGCPAVIEPDGSRRNALLDDYIKFIRLVQQSPGFRLNGGILAQPSDIKPEWSHMLMHYATILNSDKCIMGQTGSEEDVTRSMEMAAIVFGGRKSIEEKPRVMTLLNTLSPLQMDQHALETLKVHAQWGQPVVICAGVMSGTTAPATLAGAIAQGNAETLAGVALTQVINPGTPVVMAINMTPVDMRTGGVNIGAPSHALAVKYCAGLSRMYKLPCRCGGTSSNANGLTAQSGYEAMMTMFVSLQEGVDLIIHSAGILDGYAGISYEKFVMDLEIIRMAEYYFQGLSLTENDLALDAIDQVGPGGQFLTHMHTMKNCREQTWISQIVLSGPCPDGVSPEDAMMEKVIAQKREILSQYKAPELNEKIVDHLSAYLTKNGVSEDALAFCRDSRYAVSQ